MKRGGRKLDPPADLTGSPLEQQAAKVKPNRLSRSFRQTQTAAEVGSPKSQRSDFKTPTRIPRSRSAAGFSGESPHNDSDFQHDIIWDATSPSPNRLSKRGRKQPSGAVDISEIVNRIAPKHGRPEVAEPTLQQWIGDSATIPCTPDVQVPKPKKKSPRPNGVDDLLKLAKQFDFNMFHQDEEEVEEVEDVLQQSPELLLEDILDFENDFLPTVSAAAGTDARVDLDRQMEDDLDFLFDGPTQHVSGALSQASSALPSQIKAALPSSSKEASGKPPVSVKFEDDWENDDLLNDSLVLEMTQNPQIFAAPKHCSTQKPVGVGKYQSSGAALICGDVRINQSAVCKTAKDNVKQRATFKLESNPHFSVKRIQSNPEVAFSSEAAGKASQQTRFGSSAETGSRCTWQTLNPVKSDQQKPQFHQRTSVSSSVSPAAKPAQRFPNKSEVVSSHVEPAAVSDFLDHDLEAFFASDLVWDDPVDDDLLCELCEDLENQIQNLENTSARQSPLIGQTSDHRTVLQPSNRTWDDRNQQPANQKPLTPRAAPGGSGGPAAGVQVRDSVQYTQTKPTSGSTSTCLQGSSWVQSAAAGPGPPQGKINKDQFTFKRPNNPVSTVTNRAVGKCSAAEIELKKQQAMERRRQRLQAAQNLRT
ncbi:ewing's tumor-associated antigen 1 isoform X2 [Lates calcarifer]|uniref:Ewing's tumor-associated antigen 1 isoform X2 n=1 Tax=Lates calcarifer TaxID=8187 RepID=A0AAJ7LTE6_LATCA|nr:ewing's tumor-associated antigen 1 isoform X2 [Lates calcarifer]